MRNLILAHIWDAFSNADEIKAMSEYVFTLGGGAILEVLQADHLNEVNYGNRNHCVRHCHY
jgi:hypothetical protein